MRDIYFFESFLSTDSCSYPMVYHEDLHLKSYRGGYGSHPPNMRKSFEEIEPTFVQFILASHLCPNPSDIEPGILYFSLLFLVNHKIYVFSNGLRNKLLVCKQICCY